MEGAALWPGQRVSLEEERARDAATDGCDDSAVQRPARARGREKRDWERAGWSVFGLLGGFVGDRR